MERSVGRRCGRTAFGALGMLVMLAVAAPWGEARARVSVRSVPKLRPAPSVSRPHLPEAPKPHLNTPPVRSVSVALPSAAPARRGVFGRFWDWLLGRKPDAAPAVQMTQGVPAPAPAPAPPATPTVVTPISSARVSGAPAPPAPQAAGLGVTPQQASAAAFSPSARKPAARPTGYVLHLTNGRRIPVAQYEEKGDQILIPQRQGSFGLPRSIIARIEAEEADPEVAPAGRGGR